MRRLLYNLIKLSIIWLICSGMFSPFFVIGGIVFVIITIYIKDKIMRVPQIKILEPWPLTKYLLWLVKEMFKCSMSLFLMIWNPKAKIDPQFVQINVPHSNRSKLTLLSSSITLTPGTITANIATNKKSTLVVHTLNHDCAEGLKDMSQKLGT